jgi:hypothetical protein
MTQYARPDFDTTPGNWSASSGTDLFDLINDASVNDTDYIAVNDQGGAAEPVTFSLSGVTDPSSNSDHSVIVRAATPGAFVNSVSLTVELKDGSTSIKSDIFSIGNSPTDYTMLLDGDETDDISTGGYTDLTLVISATDNMESMTETRVYDAYFECPDAAASVAKIKGFSLVTGGIGPAGTSFSLVGDDEDDS